MRTLTVTANLSTFIKIIRINGSGRLMFAPNSYMQLGVNASYSLDTLNDRKHPTDGQYLRLSLKICPPQVNPQYDYNLYSLDYRLFREVFLDHTIGYHLSIQQVTGRPTVYQYPVLGAYHSMRSVVWRRYTDKAMMLNTLEYRWPLFPLGDSINLQGTVFLDAGQVGSDFSGLNLSRFIWGSGVGLEFILSSGFTIGVDLGQSNGDLAINLGFGESF